MNADHPAMEMGADWQVPAFDESVYAARRRDYALVIPVINEGDRIRDQLTRIASADLPVDVIIADGGSTDGSLAEEFVRSVGVRCVLTKRGPGKLSAQLRIAYAWCLREGYEGIVTIDGNGKDGVEAVATMVARLEEGCDYVQGSRYLPGGLAQNTPLERTIANRLVHAPLLSLAARRWFSDTTNGFRAYSRAYLLHPEVRPFRDEFQVYGLLFYLTVRAGQLGLRVDQVPVKRRYPDDGKVPTKIGGLGPKLALLGETVHAATGGHTPEETARSLPSRVWAVLIAVASALMLLAGVIAAPPYSPDSWAVYELSQTIFGDFYRFTHWRSYASDAAYSSAFPPLWPMLVAATDAAFGTGLRTGLYLAFAAFVAFAMLSEELGRRVTGAAWIGLGAAMLILLGPKMLIDELWAGRTMPMQMALFAAIALVFVSYKRLSIGHGAVLGALCGLCVMNRFDAALLPFLVAGLAFWLTRRFIVFIAVIAAAVLVCAPWIAYSLQTFGTLFATDNAGVATTLDPDAFVTDWWPAPQPSIADDPTRWALRVMANAGAFVYIAASIVMTPMVAVFVLAVAVPAGLHHLASRRPSDGQPSAPGDSGLAKLALFACLLAMIMLPQIITGYVEYRYFSPVFWIVFLCAGCWIALRGANTPQRRVFAALVALPMIGAGLVFASVQLAKSDLTSSDEWASFDTPLDVATLDACLPADARADARILVLGDPALAAKAGAMRGLPTMMEPRNMARGRLSDESARAFVREWQVTHVLVAEPTRRVWALRTFAPLDRIQPCGSALYSLR